MPVFTRDDVAILYVHVPKAGGSAIENHFTAAGFTMSYWDGPTGPGTLNHLRRCSPQHMHADLLRRTFRIQRFTAVFTVVREPLARFRSEYSMRNRRNLDVSAAATEAWTDTVLQKYRKDPFVLDNHIRPQTEFLLARSLVHRLEDGLEPLMHTLNDRYGLDIPTRVKEARTSSTWSGTSSKEVELSTTLEKRLREFYAADFERLGY